MTIDANKAVVRRWTDMLNHRDFAHVGEIYAADYLYHAPDVPPGLPRGPEGVRQMVKTYLGGFPDFALTVEDLIAEGDKVLLHYTIRGTHTGEFQGVAPTGRRVELGGLTLLRLANGKVVEEWEFFDALGLMRQLGVAKLPEPVLA